MTFSHTDFDVIAALDLDPIKVKLMHEESGEGWSLEQATAVEFEYRRFLFLMKKFPEEGAAPRVDVDIFWHYHILDTVKYAQDCEEVFGYFLHHFPYIGLRGAEDLESHQHAGERMRELYEDTFDEPFMQGAVTTKPVVSATASPTAFSTRISATAFSTRISATAFSTRVSATAFSTRVSATAFSTRVSQVAVTSMVSGEDATADKPQQSWNPQAAGFFTVRPALPHAVARR